MPTWLHRFWDTEAWSTPGGEFDPTSSATTEVPLFAGRFTWNSEQMGDDVQGWLDNPDMNFDWLVMGNEDKDRTTKRFRSRESPVEDERPTLIVEYHR